MDIAALIVSIVSIVVSLAIAIYGYTHSKKINDINLEAELSKDIFKEYLTKKIGSAVHNISFDKKKLSNIDELQKVLNAFCKDLLFYQYFDPEFYKDLKDACQMLEDYIVRNEGKEQEQDELINTYKNIITYVRVIYGICQKKYTGSH